MFPGRGNPYFEGAVGAGSPEIPAAPPNYSYGLYRPDVIGATSSAELADEGDGSFQTPEIAELKYAGAMQLPVMARFLDSALGQVMDATNQQRMDVLFTTMINEAPVEDFPPYVPVD